MKKNKLKKVVALLIAAMMTVTLCPFVYADVDDTVIFPITVQQEYAKTLPFAEGVTKVDSVDLGGTAGYEISFGGSNATIGSDSTAQYTAVPFFSRNATSGDNAYFGVSFGKDLTLEDIPDPSRAFLSFDFFVGKDEKTLKADVSQIYIGSMYKNGDTWVKRTPVNLSLREALVAQQWKNLVFTLADLGVTSSDSAFEGIYFEFDNIKIPSSTGKLWENVARFYNMAIVDSIGADSQSSVTVSSGQEINIQTDAGLNCKANRTATFPENTTDGTKFWSFINHEEVMPFQIQAGPAAGDIAGRHMTSKTPFQQILISDIRDYELEVTFYKSSDNKLTDDLAFGFGNVNGTSDINTQPTVIKTYPIKSVDPEFDFLNLKKDIHCTITMSVKDILDKGTETRFNGTGANESKEINDLTTDNINQFVVTATFAAAPTGTTNILKFDSVILKRGPVVLEDTTVAGSDISWAEPSKRPFCYSVFDSNGNKVCDTTATTVADTAGGEYYVYAYYGNDIYSSGLHIVPSVAASIIADGSNLVFNFGSGATSDSVAIIAEYSADYSILGPVTIIPISEAEGTPATLTVAKPTTTNKIKAFLFKDLGTSITPLASAFVE